MGFGLLFAFLAAALTAGATVLQAIGVRRARHFDRVNPRLLLSAIHMMPYVMGLVLLALSFIATMLALRTTGLSVVQALSAASIAGIAATSAMIFRIRLHWVEWSAVAAVCVGVILLVVTQRPSSTPPLPALASWATLIAAGAIAIGALHAHTLLNGVAVPSLLAGLAYGDAAVAGRMIAQLDGSVGALLGSPATYAVVVSGLMGTLLYATALQRGSVTAVFGLSTVGQTVGPAVIGWMLLGDSVRPGTLPVAATGFAVSIVAALVLGRHAHPESTVPTVEPAMAVPPVPAGPPLVSAPPAPAAGPVSAADTVSESDGLLSPSPVLSAAPVLIAPSVLSARPIADGGAMKPVTVSDRTLSLGPAMAVPPTPVDEQTVQIVRLSGGAVPQLMPQPLRIVWCRTSRVKSAVVAATVSAYRTVAQRRKAADA